MKKVIIIGGGNHAKVVIDILRENNTDIYTILDDDESLIGKKLMGVEITDKISMLNELSKDKYEIIISIGTPRIRKKIFNKIKNMEFEFANAIHPNADLAKSVITGKGLVINSGVVVHPDVKLEDNIILGMNVTVSHDSLIEKHVHISPGVHITGECEIEECVELGTGAMILPRNKIGKNSVIGAGAVVNKDIEKNVTAVGVPVKVIKKNK